MKSLFINQVATQRVALKRKSRCLTSIGKQLLEGLIMRKSRLSRLSLPCRCRVVFEIPMKVVAVLMLLVTVGVGNAWGGTYSLTPDQTSTGSSSTSYITTLTEFTFNGVSWKMNQWNPKDLQIKTNQTSAASEFRFYNTSAFSGRITKVVITFSALSVTDAGKLMFLGGTSEVTATTRGTAGSWNSTAKTLTWTPSASDNFTYFAFYQDGKAASGTNNLATSDAIVVTYESATAYDVYFYSSSTSTSTKISESSAGNGVTPPTMQATCGDWTFQGWSNSYSDNESSTKELSLVTLTDGKYYPTSADEKLYPVYTKTSGGNEQYKLVSTLTSENDYIFVTSNSAGTGYAFSSGITTGTSVTIVSSGSDKVVSGTPGNNIIWTVATGWKLTTKDDTKTNKGLTINGNTFGLTASASNVYWSSDYGLYGQSSSGKTSYYVQYSSNAFSKSTTTGSSTNRVWAYEKTGGSSTYYYSYPSCCEILGQINGSVILYQRATEIYYSRVNKSDTELVPCQKGV